MATQDDGSNPVTAAASQEPLISAAAGKVLSLSKGRMRVPLEELGPALFNRQGMPTCSRHCKQIGQRIIEVESFQTFRYNYGYCHEPDPSNPLAVSRHGNKMADRDIDLPRLPAKPLKGVFAKTHLVTFLQLLKSGRQPELLDILAKQRAKASQGRDAALQGDRQDELDDVLENGIFMHVFPWSVVRDHRHEIVALMAADNFDHGHGLTDSEIRCVQSMRHALLTLDVPLAASQGEVVRRHVQRLAGQRWHEKDLDAFWNFATTTTDNHLQLMMEIWVFAGCESVLRVEAAFFGAVARLPAKMQWTRAALAVAQFLSDEKECSSVRGGLVAGAVSKAAVAKLAARDRSEDQRTASQAAEDFLEKIMATYYMPWSADSDSLPFNRQAWIRSLGQILGKAGKQLAADKSITTDLQAKWEVKLRTNLENGLQGAMPERITAASQEESQQAKPGALQCGVVKANASGQAQVPPKRLASESGFEQNGHVIRKTARTETAPKIGVLHDVTEGGASVKWENSDIELIPLDEIMPWTVKQEKTTAASHEGVMGMPGMKWAVMSNNQNTEMLLHLAKGALYQIYVHHSAAHAEIHIVNQGSAASQGKALTEVAVFTRKEFKVGALAILPFSLDFVDGNCKRPAGAAPLELVIMPDGEKPTRVSFWVKPAPVSKGTSVSQEKATVIVPFWLMTRSFQQAKKVTTAASHEGVAASQGDLVYKTTSFELQSPSAPCKAWRNMKSKIRMRIPYLTNDSILEKACRLVAKDDMPLQLEEDTT